MNVECHTFILERWHFRGTLRRFCSDAGASSLRSVSESRLLHSIGLKSLVAVTALSHCFGYSACLEFPVVELFSAIINICPGPAAHMASTIIQTVNLLIYAARASCSTGFLRFPLFWLEFVHFLHWYARRFQSALDNVHSAFRLNLRRVSSLAFDVFSEQLLSCVRCKFRVITRIHHTILTQHAHTNRSSCKSAADIAVSIVISANYSVFLRKFV